MGPSPHAGRRLWGVREASRSLAGLRPTRAEKDAQRASSQTQDTKNEAPSADMNRRPSLSRGVVVFTGGGSSPRSSPD